jgi:hypothetical protein
MGGRFRRKLRRKLDSSLRRVDGIGFGYWFKTATFISHHAGELGIIGSMSSFDQKDLFGAPQPDLFGDDAAPTKSYQVNPQHVRNRFIDFLAQTQAAEVWPWDDDHVDTLRERTWPYLLEKLGLPEEAADWKSKLETEAARLDAARAKAA